MPIRHIHTYLVHPGKGSETPREIGGAAVPLEGKLFDLLSGIYAKSDNECDIEISFNQGADGKQQNPCRSLLIAYAGRPTLIRGRQIAERLEKVTTHRSGLGLLFLMAGKEGENHKTVISRFPADSGILAEVKREGLTVEFLERVFMKSATAYKAALYQDMSLASGFWLGKAIDKQINDRVAQLSNYWISEFLDSDFRTTSAAGTRRLAVALRDAAKKSSDITVRREIAAAVTLGSGLKRRRLSIREFGQQFGLSDSAMQAISDQVRVAGLVDERFQFDLGEFEKQVAYRSVELDSGAILTAPSSDFDNVFQHEVLDKVSQRVRYSTEGRVLSEKLKKTP